MASRKQMAFPVVLVLVVSLVMVACTQPAPAAPAAPASAPKATAAPAAPAGAAATTAPAAPAAQPTQPAAAAPAKAAAGEKQLEIISQWTSGGEAAALDSLFGSYKKAYPGVDMVNAAISGGTGGNVQMVLQSRLAGNNPPDAWQTQAGWILRKYVDPGYVQPVDDIFQELGLGKSVPQSVIDLVTFNGHQYSVPTNVHRGNGFFYNKKLMDRLGIKVGATLSWDEFFQIADKMKAAGVPALSLGDSAPYVAVDNFTATLVGVLGPDKYNGLFTGKVGFDDPDVKKAMQTFGRMLDYANPDHASLTWDQSARLIIEGKAGFTCQGDWAFGEFVKAGMNEETEIGWVSSPGTAGSFVVVIDSMVMAKGAPHPVNARNWLKTVGSAEAQAAFGPIKGAIPARTDADKSKFGPYLRWSMDSFAKDKLVPTLTHGIAAPPDFTQASFDATGTFVANRNVDAYSKALVDAAKAAKIGQ